LAQSDVSLRLIALVAIGGIADMPRASGACRSGASDPTETLAARDLCGAHCRTAHHFPLVRYAVLHSTYQELAEHYGLGLTGEPQGLPPKVERR
jgi:hypothetical protein